jgi:hypothetical protein
LFVLILIITLSSLLELDGLWLSEWVFVPIQKN